MSRVETIRPGGSLEPSVLNEFQDRQDRRFYSNWVPLGDLGLAPDTPRGVAFEEPATDRVYGVPSPLPQSYPGVQYADGRISGLTWRWNPANYSLGTAASPARQLKMRVSVRVVTNGTSPGARLTNLRMATVDSIDSSGYITGLTYVSASELVFPSLTANMDQTFRVEYTAPAAGNYTFRLQLGSYVASSLTYLFSKLELRAVV